MDREKIYRECLKTYGINNQIDMAIEEMSELIKALLKYRRAFAMIKGNDVNPVAGRDLNTAREDIIDELADVKIMVRQMEIAFQTDREVESRIDFKVNRQRERLDERRGI
ncbi:MAG: hypothetical protein IJ706_08380 [Clostridia bacterium]|nr:hypothetical protein [Clostridia bacterium]